MNAHGAQRFTWRTALVAAGLVLACSAAWADIHSFIRKFTMDRLELEVRVTDAEGQALPGALVWYVGTPIRPQTGVALDAAIFTRMAQRYAAQSDFLSTSDVPNSVFERTDVMGIYRDFREVSSANSQYSYLLVATKRGHVPRVIEGTTPFNERHVVTFKLERDAKAQPEPGMEQFDRLMAQARSPVPGEDVMGEARMHKLDQMNRQMRALARELEAQGLADQASAVYWNLADFPEVIRITAPDGKVQVAGYRNSGTGPAAEADRVRATQLNTRVPKLLIDKAMMDQGFGRVGIANAVEGLAYLKAFDQLASGPLREQILPVQYRVAIYQALRWGTPEQACNLLQRAHNYEPAAMPLKDWWARLDDVQKRRQGLKLPGAACLIEGLPARPAS